MLRWLFTLLLIISLFLNVFGAMASADVYVKGYFRKDGTYVSPHFRSNPDGISSNNWSTYGNLNPYTGDFGTKSSENSFKRFVDYNSNGYGNSSSSFSSSNYSSLQAVNSPLPSSSSSSCKDQLKVLSLPGKGNLVNVVLKSIKLCRSYKFSIKTNAFYSGNLLESAQKSYLASLVVLPNQVYSVEWLGTNNNQIYQFEPVYFISECNDYGCRLKSSGSNELRLFSVNNSISTPSPTPFRLVTAPSPSPVPTPTPTPIIITPSPTPTPTTITVGFWNQEGKIQNWSLYNGKYTVGILKTIVDIGGNVNRVNEPDWITVQSDGYFYKRWVNLVGTTISYQYVIKANGLNTWTQELPTNESRVVTFAAPEVRTTSLITGWQYANWLPALTTSDPTINPTLTPVATPKLVPITPIPTAVITPTIAPSTPTPTAVITPTIAPSTPIPTPLPTARTSVQLTFVIKNCIGICIINIQKYGIYDKIYTDSSSPVTTKSYTFSPNSYIEFEIYKNTSTGRMNGVLSGVNLINDDVTVYVDHSKRSVVPPF